MSGLIGYVKKTEAAFDILLLGRVDALALSWLSYFNYPDKVCGGEGIRLADIAELPLPENMFDDAFNPKKSRKLFKRICQSPRFRDIELSDFTSERDESDCKQFAAVTMKLAPDIYFLSYRGTDPSFVGWKENFDMIYRYPLPSQTAALEYAQRQLTRFPDARFYFGGHSKGGNIAVYAAAHLTGELAARVETVFNFDGPSFIKETKFAREQKTVPVSSFVGMLLEKGRAYTVVKSRSVSVLQHDPFSWRIKHGDFVTAKHRTDTSVRLERALNRWVDELGLDERKRLVDIVYTALNKLDTRDFNVFFKTVPKQAIALGKEHKKLNPADKEFFDGKVRRFKRILKKNK